VTDEEIFEAIRHRVGQGRPSDSDQAWPPPAPASEDDVRRAEAAIGYPLPPLVRRMYLDLAVVQCAAPALLERAARRVPI
jgi:hypothetical protein